MIDLLLFTFTAPHSLIMVFKVHYFQSNFSLTLTAVPVWVSVVQWRTTNQLKLNKITCTWNFGNEVLTILTYYGNRNDIDNYFATFLLGQQNCRHCYLESYPPCPQNHLVRERKKKRKRKKRKKNLRKKTDMKTVSH